VIRAGAAALLALLLAVPAAEAQELGRLFLTPDQRDALDARRKARVPDKPEAAPAAVAPVRRIDGYVQRGGGRSTVWVNGEPIPESGPQAGARIRGIPAGDGRIAVPLDGENREASARVGQSIDTVTGEVRDPLGDGEIRMRRVSPKPTGRN
jgi:hypothetical protein